MGFGSESAWLRVSSIKELKHAEGVNWKKKNNKGGSGKVDYLPASCILLKLEVIERVGKLPEEYFFAYEEADFALNVKRAGYKVVVEPKAHIWHKVGLSSTWTPEMIYNSYRNRFLFLKRNYVFPFNLLFMIPLVIEFAKPVTPGKLLSRKLLVEALFDHIKFKSVEEAHLLRIKQKYSNQQEVG